jgi:hypothetical protein
VDRLLETVAECLTPDVARALVNIPAEPDLQAHIDELSLKHESGTLTAAEQAEYRDIAQALELIGMLQTKAREHLAEPAAD